MSDKCIILITCPDEKNAEELAMVLLKKKLVACVSLVPGIKSFYWWKKKIEKDLEVLMIIKTKRNFFKSVEKEVLKLHPYSVPEIICINIEEGFEKYLKWINGVLR
ncbi:MAG: divalent-cation tolerance protein CutA [Candidatus Aenigmatarchaeota archaeon]